MAKAFLESPRLDDQQYAIHLLTKAAQGLENSPVYIRGNVITNIRWPFQTTFLPICGMRLRTTIRQKKSEAPLKELTSKMTPEELAEAKARVDTWKPTPAKSSPRITLPADCASCASSPQSDPLLLLPREPFMPKSSEKAVSGWGCGLLDATLRTIALHSEKI